MIRKLPESLKRTLFLYSAQITNLIFGWAVAKINISYLSVDEYGQYTFLFTLINVIFVFFSFGAHESASRLIALSKNRDEYRKILGASSVFTFGAYLLFSLLFFIGHYFVDDLFQVKASGLMLLAFPLAGIFLMNSLWQLALRGKGAIGKLSIFTISPRLIYLLLMFLMIWRSKFTLNSTVLAFLISMHLVNLAFILIEKPAIAQFGAAWQKLLREIRSFGIHVYWSEIIKVFLYHTDKLLISYFLDARNLAFYGLAYTVTFPISFFSNALSTTYYRSFSREKRIHKGLHLLNLVWVCLTVIAMILLKEIIILRLFSDRYATSLTVFVILAAAFGLAGMSKLYSFFLTAKGAGREIRNISVAVLILHLGGNLLLIPRNGIIGAAWATFFSYLVDLILCIYYYYRFINRAR
ncbi:MAG: oligosaccharide flippase family protein [Calditrichia bacterium]